MYTQQQYDDAKYHYAIYLTGTGGKNYQGLDCPMFGELTETIQNAWARIAVAHGGRPSDSAVKALLQNDQERNIYQRYIGA